MIAREHMHTAMLVIAEAIQSLQEVPSGDLYVRVMPHMSHEVYERIINALIASQIVERRAHVLRWVGPALRES